MVKRNTDYKQMFLVDNILFDRIKCSSKSNYDLIKSEEKCKECSTHPSFLYPETSFPESILKSNKNLNRNDLDQHTSSESSSDDDDGDDENPTAMTQPHTPMDLSINQIDSPPPEDVSINENQLIQNPLVRLPVNIDNLDNDIDTQVNRSTNFRERSPLRRQLESDVPSFSLPVVNSKDSEQINRMDTEDVQPIQKTNDDLEKIRKEERKQRLIRIRQRQAKILRKIKKQNRKKGKQLLDTDEDQIMQSDNDKEDNKIDDEGDSPYGETSNGFEDIRKEERRRRLLRIRKGQAKILRNIQRKNRNDQRKKKRIEKYEATRDLKSMSKVQSGVNQDKNMESFDEKDDFQSDKENEDVKISSKVSSTPQKQRSRKEIKIKDFASQRNLPKTSNTHAKKKHCFCELCGVGFENYSLFREHFKHNHKRKQYTIKFPNTGKYKAVALKKVKRKSKIVNKNKIFYDNFDSKDKDYDNFDSKDMGKTTHKELTSYWCSKCQKFFQNFNLLQDHMKKDHSQGDVGSKRSISKGTFYEKF